MAMQSYRLTSPHRVRKAVWPRPPFKPCTLPLLLLIPLLILIAGTQTLRFLASHPSFHPQAAFPISSTSYYVRRSIPVSPATIPSPPAPLQIQRHPHILILDYWERLGNIQRGMLDMVQLGRVANFSLVEPHLFEARAQRKLSFPSQFRAAGLMPQPGSNYFDFSPYEATGHFLSFSRFASSILAVHTPTTPTTTTTSNSSSTRLLVARAAIYFTWHSARPAHKTPVASFCDGRARHSLQWSPSPYGFEVAPGVHVQRVICVHPVSAWRMPVSDFFEPIFELARTIEPPPGAKCVECLPILFPNFRKQIIAGLTRPTDDMPTTPKRLRPGIVPQQLASQLVARELPAGFVGVHLRTGKTFSMMRRHKIYINGGDEDRTAIQEIFRRWLLQCVSRVADEALSVGRARDVNAFYVASDMFNDGWKGGDDDTARTRAALREGRKLLRRELREFVRFDAEKEGLKQDHMGMASMVDAEMSLRSEEFVYSGPSTFGEWIQQLRVEWREKPSEMVDCRPWELNQTFVNSVRDEIGLR